MHEENNYLVDPHTAVGIHVASQHRTDGIPLLCLSTAHAAKFEDAVRRSVPDLVPNHPILDALEGKPTRKENLDADVDQVKAFIKQHSGINPQ